MRPTTVGSTWQGRRWPSKYADPTSCARHVRTPPARASPVALDPIWTARKRGQDDLWDRVDRGDIWRAAELRQWLDGFGITPKGQQDRRWTKPAPKRLGWDAGGVDLYARPRFGVQQSGRSRFRDLAGAERSIRDQWRRMEAEHQEGPVSRFETLIEPEPDTAPTETD